jgi:hypothetical protein
MEGVHNTRHIAQQGKHEIKPKLASQTDGTKHTERWQYNSKDYLDGTRNHGSHEALLFKCKHRTRGLVPGQSTGFPSHGMQILYHSAQMPKHRAYGKRLIGVLDMATVRRW